MINESGNPLEYSDEAGRPDELGAQAETQLAVTQQGTGAKHLDRPRAAVALFVVRENDEHEYSAIIGDEEVDRISRLGGPDDTASPSHVGPRRRY